jgi:hypothetical protein
MPLSFTLKQQFSNHIANIQKLLLIAFMK